MLMKEAKETLLLLLGFIPWLLFLFLSGHSLAGLERAVVICLLATVAFGINHLRKGFILQWGSLVFFAFCFVSLNLMNRMWVANHVALLANGTLAAIIWISIFSHRPFALQYARENLPKEMWSDPELLGSCMRITAVWGALMLLSVAISVFRMSHQGYYPERVYFDASLLTIIGGVAFTVIYKHRRRRRRARGAIARSRGPF